MAKNKISEWSATASNNTDVGGIDIAEGCAPSGINNAIREMMAQIKDQQAGTDADNFTVGGNLIVTGTTTLTGVPTAPTAAGGTNTTQIATTAFVVAALALMYTVGSIYTSTVSTNPNTLFGFGTWVAFGAGRVLVGNGGAFSAGATGGSADAVVVSHSHTLTDTGHEHSMYHQTIRCGNTGNYWNALMNGLNASSGGAGTNPSSTTTSGNGALSATTGISIASAGVSGTNANLQPYVVVYMWTRTA